MQAREMAERQPRWRPVARLVEQSDDVADALEEAAFLISLMADHHLKGWDDHVRKVLARLAATVLQATQDQVKALAIARTLGGNSEAVDNDAFLRATWRVLQAERQSADASPRDARRDPRCGSRRAVADARQRSGSHPANWPRTACWLPPTCCATSRSTRRGCEDECASTSPWRRKARRRRREGRVPRHPVSAPCRPSRPFGRSRARRAVLAGPATLGSSDCVASRGY